MRMRFAQEENLAARKVEIEPKKKSEKPRRLFALHAYVRAHERAVRLFDGRAEMAQKAGFCPQKRAKSGICGSSRRDLPTCASACVIERKHR